MHNTHSSPSDNPRGINAVVVKKVERNMTNIKRTVTVERKNKTFDVCRNHNPTIG